MIIFKKEFPGFPGGSVVKYSPCQCETRDTSSIPGSERCPGGGKSNPLQRSCLKFPWTAEPGRLQSMGNKATRHRAAEHSTQRKTTSAIGQSEVLGLEKTSEARTGVLGVPCSFFPSVLCYYLLNQLQLLSSGQRI